MKRVLAIGFIASLLFVSGCGSVNVIDSQVEEIEYREEENFTESPLTKIVEQVDIGDSYESVASMLKEDNSGDIRVTSSKGLGKSLAITDLNNSEDILSINFDEDDKLNALVYVYEGVNESIVIYMVEDDCSVSISGGMNYAGYLYDWEWERENYMLEYYDLTARYGHERKFYDSKEALIEDAENIVANSMRLEDMPYVIVTSEVDLEDVSEHERLKRLFYDLEQNLAWGSTVSREGYREFEVTEKGNVSNIATNQLVGISNDTGERSIDTSIQLEAGYTINWGDNLELEHDLDLEYRLPSYTVIPIKEYGTVNEKSMGLFVDIVIGDVMITEINSFTDEVITEYEQTVIWLNNPHLKIVYNNEEDGVYWKYYEYEESWATEYEKRECMMPSYNETTKQITSIPYGN